MNLRRIRPVIAKHLAPRGAEAPDERVDLARLPSWMRQPAPAVAVVCTKEAEALEVGGGEWDAVDTRPAEEGDQAEKNSAELPG